MGISNIFLLFYYCFFFFLIFAGSLKWTTAAGKGTQEVFILVFLKANFHVYMRQNQNFAIKKSTVLKTVHSAI